MLILEYLNFGNSDICNYEALRHKVTDSKLYTTYTQGLCSKHAA